MARVSEPDAGVAPPPKAPPRPRRGTSALTRRMIGIAAIWIGVLLLIGGYSLDRVLTRSVVANFDAQLNYVLNAMIAASEIGPDGEVRFTRPPADQRFLEPYSGVYFQVSGKGADTFPSRSGPDHIGIISDRVDAQGLPLVINNWTNGTTTAEMDLLTFVPVLYRFRLPS